MNERLTNAHAAEVLRQLVHAVQANKAYLSELDGATGDGDHGVNMNKGFTLFEERWQARPGTFSHGLALLGDTLLTDIGGSMGPLYGMFFTAMADACREQAGVDAACFGAMLDAGADVIQTTGGATRGDKTLLDVLLPAREAYRQKLAAGGSFTEALAALKAAAIAGRDATRDMVAKVGRASRLGARSRGFIDAGAASCCLILVTMADAITNHLER